MSNEDKRTHVAAVLFPVFDIKSCGMLDVKTDLLDAMDSWCRCCCEQSPTSPNTYTASNDCERKGKEIIGNFANIYSELSI